ncbi:formate dehydrogenase subunit delta [Tropicimonas aquimaris]|uniref:Formate dehydrogenase subunit delta n=1 Tax=Tropicimonas aquimaris TaxID=914152 RepID=A0ABW3IM66_9RHOB
MSQEKIAYMANQIATAFATRPEPEAVEAVAAHINQFWEPRMRLQLLDLLASEDVVLSDLVRKAGPEIRRPAASSV